MTKKSNPYDQIIDYGEYLLLRSEWVDKKTALKRLGKDARWISHAKIRWQLQMAKAEKLAIAYGENHKESRKAIETELLEIEAPAVDSDEKSEWLISNDDYKNWQEFEISEDVFNLCVLDIEENKKLLKQATILQVICLFTWLFLWIIAVLIN